MSQKKSRRRRSIEALLQSAHVAVHLLLNLKDAIANRGVAAECGRTAETLSDAIRRVAEHGE
jgi:hypothetical protein